MEPIGSTRAKAACSWGALGSAAARIRIAVVGGLLLLVYWNPIRHTLVGRWMTDGNWSHGWLIPLFSLYFLATRRRELLQCRPRPKYAGALILAVSLAVYFVSVWWFRMAYPQAVSMIGAIFGLTLLLGGWSVIRVAWFPILFLLLAVPLPQRIYVELTMPLRRVASSAAAMVLPLFAPGLHAEAQAVVIDFVMPGMPPGTLNIEEACSGMRLTMAFITLGFLMAYLGERPFWQRLVLVLSCLPIAVVCNAIRVTITGLVYVYGYRHLAQGTPHQLLGMFMLGVALGLFALLRYVLGHLFLEEADEPKAPAALEAEAGAASHRRSVE